jgi:hypothetical protein
MKNKSYPLVLAAILVLVTPLLAQHKIDVQTSNDGHKKIMRIHNGGDMLGDPLNLTDAQKKDFKKLDLQFKKDTISLKNELELKKLEKEVELEADSPDLKKLNPLIDATHSLQASMEKKKMAVEFKKRALMTKEQLKHWRPMTGHIEKKIIMLKGDGAHDMHWIDDIDFDMPIEREIEEKIEIR